MNTKISEKYFLYILLAIIIILTLAIFRPFLSVVVLSIAFSVILTPVYKWIKNHITKNIPWIASLLTIVLFFIVLCVPIFFVGKTVFNQVQHTYLNIALTETPNSFIQKIDTSINKLMPDGFYFNTHDKIIELTSVLINNIASFFTSIFNGIIMFILMLLTIFYLLKDGAEWKKSLVYLCPISEKHTAEIFTTMKDAINRIFKGSFLIAIIQGILMAIGLTVFGVPNAAVWGVVTGMASFVPTIGTSIVAVPVIIFLFFTSGPIYALGMLLWSIIMVGLIDNVLSPYLISKNTNISSLFVLFSILGGISLMGPVGLFIGPLVLSLLYSLVSIYKKDNLENI